MAVFLEDKAYIGQLIWKTLKKQKKTQKKLEAYKNFQQNSDNCHKKKKISGCPKAARYVVAETISRNQYPADQCRRS